MFDEPDEKVDIEIHPYDPTAERRQIDRLQRIRRERDNAKVDALLDRLVAVAKDEQQNIMPVTIELVAAGASMGDIVERLKTTLGHLPRNHGVLMTAPTRLAAAPGRRPHARRA